MSPLLLVPQSFISAIARPQFDLSVGSTLRVWTGAVADSCFPSPWLRVNVSSMTATRLDDYKSVDRDLEMYQQSRSASIVEAPFITPCCRGHTTPRTKLWKVSSNGRHQRGPSRSSLIGLSFFMLRFFVGIVISSSHHPYSI